jgi:type VI secretion system secreted protein Hcp
MSNDIFLKIEGVEGESMDSTHKNEIEVTSFNWGMSQSASMHVGSGGGAGKVSVNDLSIVHRIDKASPTLMQMCMTGKHIPSAVLTLRKAGENPLDFYIITMTDVMVTAVEPSPFNERFQLAFSKVKIEYQPQGKDGSASGGMIITEYDIKANKQM